MYRQLGTAFRMTLLFTVLTGLLYPGLVTALSQALFPRQANGSMVTAQGRVVGSALIGQQFSRAEYLNGRPSASNYDATSSGGTNLGPGSAKLAGRLEADAAAFRKANPAVAGPLPADLVTASGSGLDPDLSPASAMAQAARIAAARGADTEAVKKLIESHVERPALGFLGEPRVNVLETNLDLDRKFPKH